ncbi:hypothetical protein J4E89_004033 [Alternaria sp. Ai002NY15]|nr:hypothetical protein J4E89_004033 [Alternaria sp. Ai002NY15]
MSYTGSTFPASSAAPPVSNTDAVPTSIGTPSSGPSSGNPATPSTPGYVPSGSSVPPSSNTDYVPTSPGAASTGSMSSGYVVPPASSAGLIARKSIPKWTNSVIELLGCPISPCWTVFQWIPRAISFLPKCQLCYTLWKPFSRTFIEQLLCPTWKLYRSCSDIHRRRFYIFYRHRILGYRLWHELSVIVYYSWLPKPLAHNSVPSGVSGGPSGSGYPYPSGGINGTIVAPYPSYIEVPINTGHVVGAGKSSLAAIVVALVFAHFA